MAASSRALFLSRFNDPDILRLSLKPSFLSPRHLIKPLISNPKRRQNGLHRSISSPPAILNCLISGVDGGGVADDFVSTRKTGFGREFSVLANMLKRIEPLDASIIAKGVSDAAKDSMKRTISTMLGLLPSDQFDVTIRVSKQPLDRLLSSSIITGYTLWNAEYRVSLMRNFDISCEDVDLECGSVGCEAEGNECEESKSRDIEGCDTNEDERKLSESLGDLSPEALSYIRELKSELANIEQKLNAQKQENMYLESNKEENNDLLDYLRSLEPDMVTELSRPSSSEVEEIIQQLVQNLLQRFFKDDNASPFLEDTAMEKTEGFPTDAERCEAIGTSRDYLAKLLLWCMLLGHHMRGLECRLQLSCVVGLL